MPRTSAKGRRRTDPDPAQLKASILALLQSRYGDDGENAPKLGLPDDELIEKRVKELIKFYKTSYPDAQGRSPVVNIFYVMAPSGYAKDSRELDRLLHEEIASAKRPATKFQRENRALQLIGEIFDQGWKRDWKTGEMVLEKPYRAKKLTAEEEEERKKQVRMMANAMWRRGSRDS